MSDERKPPSRLSTGSRQVNVYSAGLCVSFELQTYAEMRATTDAVEPAPSEDAA